MNAPLSSSERAALLSAARIDARAHISPGLALPADLVVHPGAYVPANVQLAAGCQIGPNAVFVEGAPIVLKPGVVVGANATVMPGVTLAAKCLVRPGAVVGRSVPPGAIVEGNPAVIVGYVNAAASPRGAALNRRPAVPPGATEALCVRGVTLHHFPVIPDLRGSLTVGEFQRQIPFTPLRYFMVFGVPSREVRGEHAHHACHQFLICVQGECSVVADDGEHRVEVVLDATHLGLYLPPMTWGIQYKYSPDAKLMGFASHHYDAADYIRDYDEFLVQCAARREVA